MEKEIIVIIGGPGTGKSTLIDGLAGKGFCCYPEISRQVTLEAKKQGIEQLFLENPLLFSELLLEGKKKTIQECLGRTPRSHFYRPRHSRHPRPTMHYIGDSYPAHFDLACRENLYSKIFILPPWEEIYVSDEARYENFEQAKLIHEHLTETYQKYGYNPIEVPKDSLDNRILFILDEIYR